MLTGYSVSVSGYKRRPLTCPTYGKLVSTQECFECVVFDEDINVCVSQVDNAYLVSRILLKSMVDISGFLDWWPQYKKYHTKGIIREIALFLAQSTTLMTT